jgi:hypothetical protein
MTIERVFAMDCRQHGDVKNAEGISTNRKTTGTIIAAISICRRKPNSK